MAYVDAKIKADGGKRNAHNHLGHIEAEHAVARGHLTIIEGLVGCR